METAGGRSASLKDHVLRSIEESIAVKELLKSQTDNIARATEIIVRCIRNGGKILLFGNGGSAADAQHIAAEFMGRYLLERPPIPAIALTVNTSSLTAIANDIGFESIFDRQINALCTSKDIVIFSELAEREISRAPFEADETSRKGSQ